MPSPADASALTSLLQWAPILLLSLYFAVLMAIAQWFQRKTNTLNDYFLAGRSLGPMVVALTLVASWFGAGSTMGSLDSFHLEGLSALWKIALPTLICYTLVTVLMAKRIAQLPTLSQPAAVEETYGAKGRFVLSLIILAAVTTFLGSQLVAAATFFEGVLGLDRVWATLCTAGVVVAYSCLGGYFAVVVTDLFQAALFTTTMVVLAGFGLWIGLTVPWPELTGPTLAHLSQPGFWNLGENFWENVALTTSFVAAWCIAPELWQRLSSLKDPNHALTAGAYGIVAIVILWTLVAVAGMASVTVLGINPNLAEGESPNILVRLAQALPHPALTILIYGGFLAAITSTLDSSLNIGSMTLTHDLYQRFFKPQADARELVWVSRVATVLVFIPAIYIALGMKDIIHVLWMSADIYASAMFVPVVALLFVKQSHRWAGLFAMACGGASSVWSAALQYQWISQPDAMAWWPDAPYSTLLGIIFSGFGFIAGLWIEQLTTNPTATETLGQPTPVALNPSD